MNGRSFSPRLSGRFALPVLCLTVLVALSAAACWGAGSDDIVIYSGRSQNLIEPLLERFEEETGITVSVRYGSSADLALLLEEEGDKTPADVFLSQSPGAIGFLAERGRLAPLSDRVLALAPGSPNGLWVAVTGRQRVLVYNAGELAPADLPESIFDLVEEPWLGRVAFAPSNGSFQDFFTLFRLEVGDDVALAWLQALVDGDAPIYGNNNAIVQAVARGEVGMGLVNHYYNFRLKAEDPSLSSENHLFADGDPGGVTIATAAGALASGDEVHAAQLIEFLLSAEAQTYFAEETFEYPLATGVEVPGALIPPGAIELGRFDELGSSLQRTIELIRETGVDF